MWAFEGPKLFYDKATRACTNCGSNQKSNKQDDRHKNEERVNQPIHSGRSDNIERPKNLTKRKTESFTRDNTTSPP